jgi:NADH-quinone oxidoreductase subunit G
MPKLIIDGKEIEVAAGTKVIEAAKMLQDDVPYYCYHPGLSVAGNCRMCLVEVEKMPKLQIACHMQVQEGMVVHTQSERVKKTREHVLEFLLINHPVDCPVCDQAGECWLQDYYMKHGLYDSRLDENKHKKPKAVPIGPNVMLDAERCILCSRCIRFSDEISKTHELGFINRGNHTEIAVAPGRELDNPYSGNNVDICPVGALTDRDFRFKIRVWYLKEENSICNGCSRGCNIQVHYNLDRPHHNEGRRVARLKPRYNEKVNEWWMCDEGRYGYKYHDVDRILKPTKEGLETDWDIVATEVARNIKNASGKVGVLLSPQLSNEDLFLAKKVFASLDTQNVVLFSPKDNGFEDDILIRADKNPNSQGAKEMGFSYDDQAVQGLLEKCANKNLKGLIVFGQDLLKRLDSAKVEAALKGLEWSVFIGSNINQTSKKTTYVLPATTHIEKEGTFTNFQGVVQKFNKVLEPLGEAKSEIEILGLLGAGFDVDTDNVSAEDLFNELVQNVKSFSNMNYAQMGEGGSDIRTMAAPTIPALEQYDNIL